MDRFNLEYYIDSVTGKNISDWFEANLENSSYFRSKITDSTTYEIDIDWRLSNKLHLDITKDTVINFTNAPKDKAYLRIVVKCAVTNINDNEDYELYWSTNIRWANGLGCYFYPNTAFLVELFYTGSLYYGTFTKLKDFN